MINDEYIKILFNKDQIFQSKIDKLTEEEKEYLLKRYTDSYSLKETIFRIKNNIDKHPLCPECNKPVKVRYRKEKPFYRTCGNNECLHKRKGNGPKEACIKKYGCNNVFQLESVKEKIKNTNYKKYGVKSHMQNNEFKEKFFNIFREKYNCINPFQVNEFKEKSKQTCLKKYGVENYSSSEISKKHMSIIASSEEFQNKRNNTLKEHKTWNISKQENKVYELLQLIFINIKRQYSSNVYPYSCDFYIPNLDLYIEYNGSDLHNFRPYTGSEEDLKEVELIKKKAESLRNNNKKPINRYDNKLYTWTSLDVRKRNIAKQNNLNFIEFWNIKEVEIFIENYKNNL